MYNLYIIRSYHNDPKQNGEFLLTSADNIEQLIQLVKAISKTFCQFDEYRIEDAFDLDKGPIKSGEFADFFVVA